MDSFTTKLTPRMALYLADALEAPLDEEAVAGWHNLVLKVYGALPDCIDEAGLKGEAQEVTFTHGDLWFIREKAKSFAMQGQERVGLALLQMVREGLLRFAADPEVHEAEMQVGSSAQGIDEPSFAQLKAANKIREA